MKLGSPFSNDTPKASTFAIARVAGGVAGGLVFLCLVILAFMLHRRRKRTESYRHGEDSRNRVRGRIHHRSDGLVPFIIPPKPDYYTLPPPPREAEALSSAPMLAAVEGGQQVKERSRGVSQTAHLALRLPTLWRNPGKATPLPEVR